jgi:2-polyprenyl-6-methoxyphenol hydroxylase-like FAD-dependent oxidoreductase
MVEADRILIVGGGIAGLTLAAALRQQGFQAQLIEGSTSWHAVGAGMAIQPNAMRALRALGLDAAVADLGAVLHRWVFRDQQGELLFEIDLQAFWEGVGPFIGIERTKLQEALLSGAAAVPSRLGTSVSSVSQRNGHVSVGFNDGSMGKYDLVVGADGIFSSIRALTFGAKSPAGAGHIAWRSVVPIRPAGLRDLTFFFGDRCFFGLCPVGNGRTYGFGHVAEPRFHDELRGRLQRLRSRFAEFCEPVQECLAALESDEQIHCSTVEWVDQEEWHTGRVVLIGDAAHASSPMMGQGGGMAMEDAYVLAKCLGSADTVQGALDAYVVRRRPRVKWVQQESLAVSESIHLPPEIRNPALKARGKEMFEHRFAPLIASP